MSASSSSSSHQQVQLPRRVLCIASHVVHGYVGNRAAVFPLQVLGYDVDVINSCQLSNHTGYPSFQGSFVTGDQVDTIAHGLHNNGLLDYDFVLTGYIANVSFLASVVELVERIRQGNPCVRWVVDPVLGDNGVLYVRPEMVQALKDTAVPHAFMITPNQMEAELLSGMNAIRTTTQMEDCLRSLHALGPRVVAVTSSELADYPNKLCCFMSEMVDDEMSGVIPASVVTLVVVPKLGGNDAATAKGTAGSSSSNAGGGDATTTRSSGVLDSAAGSGAADGQDFSDENGGYFTGTGDCLAALLLAWTASLGAGQAGKAMMTSQATMRHVLRTTETHRRIRLAAATASRQKLARSSVDASAVGTSAGDDSAKMTVPGVAGGQSADNSVTSSAEMLNRKAVLARCSELALIASKGYIENPLAGDGEEDRGDVDVTVWTLTL